MLFRSCIDMAAIIEDNVNPGIFRQNGFDHLRVVLAADEDLNRILPMGPAFRIDVEADDLRASPQIAFPHLERTTAKHPDLEHYRLCIAETREMPLVDVKVMNPFMQPLGGVFEKVSMKKA